MNVELRHLRAFVAVATELHFNRAAARLHMSQPALSQTVRQLEDALGFPLLARTTRSAVLTPNGELFLTEARAVLDRFDRAMGQAHRVACGLVGQVRLGHLNGAAIDHMPAILRAFGETYPEVSLEVVEYDFRSPEAGLDVGATDVAILRPPVDLPSGAHLHVLRSEPRVACVADLHPLAAHPEVRVADLLDQPIVAAPGSGTWRDYWLLLDHRGDSAPPVVYEAATFEAELQAVASGRGISITPATAARFYARPGLAFPVITDATWCDVAVVLPPSPLPAARRFADLARRIVGATSTT
ncbi:LysR family transcriptional regulator [Streptomyces sp. NPDC056716]|uniref:LysR family transcriptional regulator n=1 Tax=unclassified Streptomyces TaxID=2593676 RepID=UPI00369AE50C